MPDINSFTSHNFIRKYYYYLHFTDEETETEGPTITFLGRSGSRIQLQAVYTSP